MGKLLTFIINPAARFGKTRRRVRQLIKEIKKQAPQAKILITRHSLHATNLAKNALLAGADRIVAIGGDGTVNEVVNGFFDNDYKPYNPKSSLAVIPSGTGSDFVRSIDQSDNLSAQVNRAIYGEAQATDVGLVRAHNGRGEEVTRYFLNLASFGLSAMTLGFMDDVTKRMGPKVAYFIASARAIRSFVSPTVIVSDESGQERTIEKCSIMCFANGKYFGGGMKVAPHAKLDDGMLDVVTIANLDLMFFLLNGYKIYTGSHLHLDNVQAMRANQVSVRSMSSDPIYIETDGEIFAQLPAQFSTIPKAIDVVR